MIAPSISGVSTNQTPTLPVGGIDPGLASGALVVIDALDKDRVLASYSMVETSGAAKAAQKEAVDVTSGFEGWGDREFVAAILRSERWLGKLRANIHDAEERYGPIAVFGVESFVDQPSRARQQFSCRACKASFGRWSSVCPGCQKSGSLETKSRLTKNIWHTPLLMGGLHTVLAEECGATVRNHRVIYQNAGIVISQWGSELAALKKRGRGTRDLVVVGDGQVGNDHERKAFVHARASSVRLRQLLREKSNPDFIQDLKDLIQERN